nr:response regulator transcription factor [uncultured Actinoplanes sp.]
MIRVLIADDQALLRASFRMLIDVTPDCMVVGEAGTGREAVALARQHLPDVVLMDVRMPDMDGIEATRRIRADPAISARVLILTTFDLDEYVFGALDAGASGFLLKDVLPPDLLAGIRVVAAGESMLAPTATRRLIAAFVRRPNQPPPRKDRLKGVTEREREILTMIARGLSNAEIAASLALSVPTVKSHVGRLLAKCDARDRTQLAVLAYETGLVTPP